MINPAALTTHYYKDDQMKNYGVGGANGTDVGQLHTRFGGGGNEFHSEDRRLDGMKRRGGDSSSWG